MALTGPRKVVQMGYQPFGDTLESIPVAASAKIYQGAMVGIDSSGNLNPMGAAGLRCRGIAERVSWGTQGSSGQAVVNSVFDNTGAGAGAFQVDVRKGVFFMINYASDPVVEGDNICYAKDDYQVMHTARGDNSVAGRVVRVVAGTEPGETNGAGVWVDFNQALGVTS